MRKKTHKEYENELFEKEIDYFPLDTYNGTHIAINHECLRGHIWPAMPKHILKGSGCPQCAGNILKTNEKYVDEIKDRPFISIEPYIKDGTPIKHKCLCCNNIWKAAPSYILRGTGCPMCNQGSFKDDKPGILYHVSLEFNGRILYKIGITNLDVKTRFKQDWNRLNMQILWEVKFPVGKDAKIQESIIKQNTTRLKGLYPLRGGGNTELFAELIPCPIK